MSINLDDYKDILDELSAESQEVLRAAWVDATKVYSPRGLDNYIKGAAALRGLGRGCNLVIAWLENAPQVAHEVGEDVVADLATTALAMASKTSGAVIEMVLATA
ncbi:MAG: VWA domain-containing protein, partial [Pseudomonadota bacterium]